MEKVAPQASGALAISSANGFVVDEAFNRIARYFSSLDLDPRARQILNRSVVTREQPCRSIS
jgi:hypothetical protein